ncbi:hypothetical protein ACIRQP_21705 [Streptomyces sp. NPDC102274]|uniref:hypothetical protein n=1 Tax=Streptomyces sp. NPDC102274 TaxID=3366151 RepID=UPI003821ACD1
MNIRIRLGGPLTIPAMGNCFRCPRRRLQTIRVGEMTSPDGPGHTAVELPLFACRRCELELMTQLAEAQAAPVRPYVAAGHPH